MPILRDEDVFWLEVAVDDPVLVRGGEAFGDLVSDLEGAADGQWPIRKGEAKGLTLQQLRDDVANVVRLAHVEEGKDVGM